MMGKSILEQRREKKKSDFLGSYNAFVSAASLCHTVIKHQEPNELLAMQPTDKSRLAALHSMIQEAERYQVALSKARKWLKKLDKMGESTNG